METAWRTLCDQVQEDPWGLPYKLIMGKLTRPLPIPEENASGCLQHIVQHPVKNDNEALPIPINGEPQHSIDRAELFNAAKNMKVNTSPGPDGIPDEVLKVIVALNPDVLTDVYNICLSRGSSSRLGKKHGWY